MIARRNYHVFMEGRNAGICDHVIAAVKLSFYYKRDSAKKIIKNFADYDVRHATEAS